MVFQYQMMDREHGQEGCGETRVLTSSDFDAAQVEARSLFVTARRAAIATDSQPPRAVCILQDGVSFVALDPNG